MTPPPIDMRHLARQHESLRRMVLALVGDEHAAEDVVQDAWVRALQSGPRDPRAAGSWLATVTRRLASNARRGRRRRDDRERRAAREEALPSSSQIAERVEIETRVLEVLEGLDEPHRTVLRDRYLGELTPTQIAQRDGASLDTVKSRLTRARAALRAKLDREGLGEDVHWSVVVLPLLSPPAPAPIAAAAAASAGASTSLGTGVLGGTLVMKKVILLASIVLASTVLWRVAQSDTESLGPDETSSVTPTDTTELVSTEDAGHAVLEEVARPDAVAAERQDVAEPVAQTAAWSIGGRARTTEGPALGVPLELAVHAGYDASGEELHKRTVASAAEGRFGLQIENPGRTVTVTIRALDAPGRAVVTYGPYVVVHGEEPPSTIDVLVFEIDAHLEGTVRDAHGQPIADCEVSGFYGHDTTDADGRYRMAIAAGAWGKITAAAKGFGTEEKALDGLEANVTAQADFTLAPEVRIEGIVVDENGSGLEGVLVETFASGAHEALTDRAGRYVLTGLSRERGSFYVRASAEGLLSDSKSVEVAGEASLYTSDFELARGVAAAGVVVDLEGHPVPGVEMWLGNNQHDWDKRTAMSDDAGRFSFDCVRVGSTKIGAEKNGFAQTTLLFEIPAGGRHDLLVELGASQVVRGVVRDRDGKAIPDVSLAAKQEREYVGGSGRSDTTGRFEVGELPTGALAIEAFGAGLVRVTVPVPENGDDVVVVMERAGGLAGRVVDAATGAPVPVFTVRFVAPLDPKAKPRLWGYRSDWSQPGRTFNSADGTWSTGKHDELQPGAWVGLEVRADGYAPTLLPMVAVPEAGADTVIVHELVQPVTVELAVSSASTGAPIANAAVQASPLRSPQRDDLRWTVTTDDAGAAVLNDVSPGPLFVRVQRTNGPEIRLGPFDVPSAARRAVIPIEVPGQARIEVTMLDADGEPLANRAALLIPASVEGVGKKLRQQTDASGIARFESAPPGNWQVVLLAERGENECYELADNVVVAEDDDVVPITLRPRGTAKVRGTIEGELQVPDGTPVSILRVAGGVHGGFVEQGRFEISGLGTGKHLVSIQYWDRNTGKMMSGNAQVEVEEDGEVIETAIAVNP
ncbi:MAG: sigma-70 family RNA polymerase sigma factor [bacterium]|nr:sigma-70 family RNA polymerase sigma factor [bacterium]